MAWKAAFADGEVVTFCLNKLSKLLMVPFLLLESFNKASTASTDCLLSSGTDPPILSNSGDRSWSASPFKEL